MPLFSRISPVGSRGKALPLPKKVCILRLNFSVNSSATHGIKAQQKIKSVENEKERSDTFMFSFKRLS